MSVILELERARVPFLLISLISISSYSFLLLLLLLFSEFLLRLLGIPLVGLIDLSLSFSLNPVVLLLDMDYLRLTSLESKLIASS